MSFTITYAGDVKLFQISDGWYAHTPLAQVAGEPGTERAYNTKFFHTHPGEVLISTNALTDQYSTLRYLMNQAINRAFTGDPDAATWDVSFSSTTLLYTISGPGSFQIDPSLDADGERFASAIGIDPAGATSVSDDVVGTMRPYYVMRAVYDGVERGNDQYEPNSIAFESEADDGASYGVARTTSPKYYDFSVQFETKETSFKANATAAVPWTWEHMFEHIRTIEPFWMTDSAYTGDVDTTLSLKMRAEGSSQNFRMVAPQLDTLWDIPFKTRVLGRFVEPAPGGP